MKCTPFPAFCLLVATAALAPTGLQAQERIAPFVGAGLAVGTGDLSQDTQNGWTVFGGLDVPVAVPGLWVGTTVSFARVPYRGGFDEVSNFTALLAEAEYVLLAGSPGIVKPYLRAGGGVHTLRYDPGRIPTNATSVTRPALGVGGGLHLLMAGVTATLGWRFLSSTDAGFVGIHGSVGHR